MRSCYEQWNDPAAGDDPFAGITGASWDHPAVEDINSVCSAAEGDDVCVGQPNNCGPCERNICINGDYICSAAYDDSLAESEQPMGSVCDNGDACIKGVCAFDGDGNLFQRQRGPQR